MSIFTDEQYITLMCALREWEHNDWTQLMQTVNHDDAIIAVYRKNGHQRYSILRAFLMGQEPEVSCECYDGRHEEAMFQLCRLLGQLNATTWEEDQI